MQSIIDPIRYNLRSLTCFRGRQGRPSFWIYVAATYVLFQIVGMIVMAPLMFSMMSGAPQSLADARATATMFVLVGIGIAVLWGLLLLAAMVRRLHDRGLSGWLTLLPLPFYVLMVVYMRRWIEMFFWPADQFDFRRFEPIIWSSLAFYAALGVLVLLLALKGQEVENRFGPPVDLETE